MRTFEQIYGEINEAQRNEPALSELNSTSQTSIWGLIKRQFSLLIRLFEVRIETYKADILRQIDEQEKGDLYYYVQKCKAFQFGDLLKVNRFGVYYDVIDYTKQIVAQCSANEVFDNNGLKILIKAAKIDSSKIFLIPLSTVEVFSLLNYIDNIKYAGIRIEVRSVVGDVMKLKIMAKMNRSLCNANGTLILNTSYKPVESGVLSFIQNLPFDSVFRWRELEAFIMKLDAVEDVSITASSIVRPSSGGTTAPTNYTQAFADGQTSGNPTEYRDYTITVPAGGNYNVKISYATAETATANVIIAGVTRTINLATTGSWNVYQDSNELTNVPLVSGSNVFRISSNSGTFLHKSVTARASAGSVVSAAETAFVMSTISEAGYFTLDASSEFTYV